MGVKSLSKFIETHAPGCLSKSSLYKYHGMKLAVDVSIYMYRFSSSMNNSPDMCCFQFERLDKRLQSFNIHPIYVFDGFPSRNKIHIIKKRQEKQTKTNKNKITGEHFRKLKDHFDKYKRDYVTANGDAEKTCAWLCMHNIVDAVVSDDYDALVYGSSYVIRNINSCNITEINLKRLLEESQMTHEEFITFCVLSGCDFTPQGKKMGYQKAFQFIKSKSAVPCEFSEAKTEFNHKNNPFFGKVCSKAVIIYALKMIILVCCAKKILWIGNNYNGPLRSRKSR